MKGNTFTGNQLGASGSLISIKNCFACQLTMQDETFTQNLDPTSSDFTALSLLGTTYPTYQATTRTCTDNTPSVSMIQIATS